MMEENKKTKTCDVDGCEKPARTNSAKYCKMHYHRMYRNGTLNIVRKRKKYLEHSGGYILVYAKNHPLCKRHKSNYEYEHRIVFYDSNGVGPFKCHWCGCDVSLDNMHIDHVDENKKNNNTDNLVPSCFSCNIERSREKAIKNHIESSGRRITHGGETKHLAEWSRVTGLNERTIAWRLERWGVEKTLTTPARPKRKNSSAKK